MKGRGKIIPILFVVAVVSALFAVGCDNTLPNTPSDEKYTLTFVTNGGSEIPPICEIGGAGVTPPENPTKSGFDFAGWYENSDFSGASVEIPSVMPYRDVTYYAKFEPTSSGGAESGIIYEFNLDLDEVEHDDISHVVGAAGETVSVKDGKDYNAVGYKFIGWSTSMRGEISLTETKAEGQYNAGESVVLGEQKLVLYAQWAREYANARGDTTDYKIYIYEPLIDTGLGGAILERAGKEDKLGFASTAEDEYSYDTFTFYSDEFENGEFSGRLYFDEHTYAVADGTEGLYLYWDYVFGGYSARMLESDGYGFAIVAELVGDQTAVREFGYYEYDEQYGDYEFAYMKNDGSTGTYSRIFYMEKTEIEDYEGFDGYFVYQGGESGMFVEYGNGELYDDYYIALNGYGYMQLYAYDYESDDYAVYAAGTYEGTENYSDVGGEWEFVSTTAGVSGFKFMLSYMSFSDGITLIYIVYDENMVGEFTDGDDILVLDGYGTAEYTSAAGIYGGECTVSNNGLVTFVPQYYNGEAIEADGKMFFNIDRDNGTFKMNEEGFAIEGTKLVGYSGTSQIVIVPDGITEIAAGAFDYNNTGVSLISVVLPSSVETIGDKAFENNYTLMRVVFTSETPIAVNWGSDVCPFRWPSASFIIVVPEDAKDAYLAAWTDCPYENAIKGSVEVTRLPEFETDGNGVLIRYNRPDAAGTDLVIPDGITAIADGVFRGMTFITSIDLNNVTTIGEEAFYGCTSLVRLVAPNLEVIGDAAFAACDGLVNGAVDGVISFPKIITVGAGAFQSCYSLVRVEFGTSLAEIGASAFAECNVYEDGPALFVRFYGTTPPTMGDRVTAGNISIKLEVNDIDFVIACYAESTWAKYCSHLFIVGGDETGEYISGADKLVLDGRAEFFSTEVMMYVIDGSKITFYRFDTDYGTYEEIEGTYSASAGITVTIDGKLYKFVPLSQLATYTSKDGKFTLIVNPEALLPDYYAESGYTGYADATLNGDPVRIYINGYNSKTIIGYIGADGRTYDLALTFDNDEFSYTQALDHHVNVTADDGSALDIWYHGNNIEVTGKLEISVGNDKTLPEWTISEYAAETSDGVITFTRRYLSSLYRITVTFDAEAGTFTYDYTVE